MSSSRQPGKDLVEFVAFELIHARAARDDHGLDVEVVERVRDAVEQHAVRRDDRLALVLFARRGLRIAAAEIARRQHRLHADVVEHRLRREADLAEQPLRAAAREIEHRVRVVAGFLRIADDRHDARILDVEQRARAFLRQIARHRLVDEVDHLRAHRRLADGRRRLARLLLRETERLRRVDGRGAARDSPCGSCRARSALIVVGSVALRNSIDAASAEIRRGACGCAAGNCASRPTRRRNRCRPGTGFTHLWHTVQWSATSPNSSKCLSEMPRRVCSS